MSRCRYFYLCSLIIINNKKYVLQNVYLPNALHSVCLNRLSYTEVGIYNGANSLNGFLAPARSVA